MGKELRYSNKTLCMKATLKMDSAMALEELFPVKVRSIKVNLKMTK